MSESFDPTSRLSDAQRKALDALVVDFERQWSPDRLDVAVAAFPAESPIREAALIAMIQIDLRRQWQSGNHLLVEAYLDRFPELGSRDSVPIGLVKAELEARQAADRSVTGAELTRRFPRQDDRLRTLSNHLDGTLAPGRDTTAQYQKRTPGPDQTVVGPVANEFGRYRVLKQLGRGGMGAVYLAEDTQLCRQVALKIPHFSEDESTVDGKDLGDAMRARFMQESRTLASLSHPNICAVFDVGAVNNQPYLTMAYIEGQTLSERVRKGGPLPVAKAIELVHRLAIGLAYAHKKGVIHRDLKPSNVMLNPEGEPIIMDFGLARRMDQESHRLTATGEALGTPAYMPPEQLRGDQTLIGPRSDLYSLGVLLFELLTRRVPFEGTPAEAVGKMLTEKPPPLSRFGEFPPELDAICQKAMAKSVEDRFQNADEFVQALDKVLRQVTAPTEEFVAVPSNTPVPRSAPRPVPRRQRRKQSSSLAPVFAVVALLGLLVGGGLFLWSPWAPTGEDGKNQLITKIVDPLPVDPGPKKIDPIKPEPKKIDPEPKKIDPEKPVDPVPIKPIDKKEPVEVKPKDKENPPVEVKKKVEVKPPDKTPVKPPEVKPPEVKPPEAEWAMLLKRAEEKQAKRDLIGARLDATRAHELAPRRPEPLLMRARVFRAQRDFAAALKDAQEALLLDPSHSPGVFSLIAEAHNQLWEFPEALAATQQGLSTAKDAARAPLLAEASFAHAGLFQWDEALRGAEEAVREGPKVADGYRARSHVMLQHGRDFVKALDDADRAVELAPTDPNGYVQRARVHFATRHFEPALRDCQSALDRDEEWAEAQILRLRILVQRNRAKSQRDAESFVTRFRPNLPGERQSAVLLGMAQSNRKVDLLRLANPLTQKHPKVSQAHGARAAAYFFRKDVDQATRDCLEALKLADGNTDALFLLGKIRLEKKDFGIAAETFSKVLKKEPRHVDAWYERAIAQYLMKDYDRATDDCNAGLDIDREFPGFYFTRGYCSLKKNDFERALKDFSDAIRLDPQNAIYFSSRAIAYQKLGRAAEAAKDLETADQLKKASVAAGK